MMTEKAKVPDSEMDLTVILSELGGVTAYTGGVGRRYAATLPHLARMGFRITLILIADSKISERPDIPSGINIITVGWLYRLPWRMRTLIRPLVAGVIVRKLGAKKVYAPEWLGMGAFLPKTTKLTTNLVTSLSLVAWAAGRNDTGKSTVWDWRRYSDRIHIALEDRQVRRSTAVIACSAAVLEWNESRFGSNLPAKSSVVRNCIDMDEVARKARSGDLPQGWPTGDPRVVLFAGRLEARKGIHVALDAFIHVARDQDDVYFVFAGAEGDLAFEPSIAELMSLIPSELHNRFCFLGNVPSGQLFPAMRAASVVACPSLWEAFGNIALEVKAAGSPLIVSSGSGFEEFCRDGYDSLMVTPGSVESLVESCKTALIDRGLMLELVSRSTENLSKNDAVHVARDLAERLTS